MSAPSPRDYMSAIAAEFTRLGLRFEDGPYYKGFAVAGTGAEAERVLAEWLQHLQSLQPGATFHEADPSLPAHWIPGDPHSWTSASRFVPLTAFDYQAPPAGPALFISWPPGATESDLDAFLSAARLRGVAIYAAGAHPVLNRPGDRYHAIIVLDVGTTEPQLEAFLAWADTEERWAVIYRRGGERYAEDESHA